MHITALVVNAVDDRGRSGGSRSGAAACRWWSPTLVPVALLTHALGADLLRNPWNPYLPILPLLLLLLLCWSVAVGDLWLLPIAIAVASFAIQSHVGLALESVAFLVVALVGDRRARRPHASPDDGAPGGCAAAKAFGVSVVVFAVLWFPVLLGHVRATATATSSELFDFFRDSHETAGIEKALEVLGLQWGPQPGVDLRRRAASTCSATSSRSRAGGSRSGSCSARRRRSSRWRRRSFSTLWLAGAARGRVPRRGARGEQHRRHRLPVPHPVDLGARRRRSGSSCCAARGSRCRRPAATRCSGSRRRSRPCWSSASSRSWRPSTRSTRARRSPTRRPRSGSITREVLEHLPARATGRCSSTSRKGGAVVAPGIALALEQHGIPVELDPDNQVVYGAEPRRRRAARTGRCSCPRLGDEEIEKLQPPPGQGDRALREAADARVPAAGARVAGRSREAPARPGEDRVPEAAQPRARTARRSTSSST